MITTYKGHEIRTNNYGNGEMSHEVKGQTGTIKFTSMVAAMNFIDTLVKN